MNLKDINKILNENDIILKGHFLLKSGKHSRTYFDLNKLSPKQMIEVCKILSDKVINEIDINDFNVVVGPASGAIVPAFLVANNLNKEFNFTEKVNNEMQFKNANNINGKNVLLVENIATTGRTIKQTIDAININGGTVVCVAIIVDRSAGRMDFGVKLISGLEYDFQVYPPKNCPICFESKSPLVKP